MGTELISRIADYEIVDTIDDTGSRASYTARTPARLGHADPIVTLEILDQFASPEEFSRVSAELRLLHSLGSPHLVEFVDAGSVDGRMYLATRHYPGGTLDRSGASLARSARVAVVSDAARGAHAMHEAGMAHREIRPSHIVLDRSRGRLSDLSRAQAFVGTTATVGAGPTDSLQFVDPDLVWGGRASRATDIWSLGITLHCALGGQAPYGEIPTGDLVSAFRHVTYNRPVLDHSFEPELLGVIDRCLAPVESRFDTALDLAHDLDDVSRQLADAESRHTTDPANKGPDR